MAPATIAGRWASAVAKRADQHFLTFADGDGAERKSWTYLQFDTLAAEVAGMLRGRGVVPGRRVHVALANSPAFLALWVACLRLGAVLVPSDPRSSEAELSEHVRRTDPVLSVRGAGVPAQSPVEVLSLDEGDTRLDRLRATPSAEGLGEAPADAPAAVLFTSGTTSAPKGVVVTQANYAFAGDVMAAAARLGPSDRFLIALPLFHANAQYYCLSAAICSGAGLLLVPRFSASRYLDQAAALRATHASLFAAPVRMLLTRTASAPRELRLRHCWYAQNLTEEQLAAFSELAGCRPRQLYGMTETMAAVVSQRDDDPPVGELGEPTPRCEVRVVDAAGRDVVDGQGELWVGGRPGLELFAGYLDDPAASAAAFAEGWFRTGDLVERSRDGRLRFCGRRGEILKVAGENVSAVEVEAALAEHRGVLEVAVVARPDPVRDEVPVAFVVLHDRSDPPTGQELLAFARQRLSPAKIPHAITIVDELPRTSVGKIRKHLLLDFPADPRPGSGTITTSLKARGGLPQRDRTP